MRRAEVTEAQIVELSMGVEGGLPVAEVMRKYWISRAMVVTWKQQYGGSTVTSLNRLREVEASSARRKRTYSARALENTAIRDVLSRAVNSALPVDRTEQDATVIAALTAVAVKRPRWGFRTRGDRLRLQGPRWNRKKVYRGSVALRRNLLRRTKRRLPQRVLRPTGAPVTRNRTWALNVLHGMLHDGRRVRTLNVID